MKLLELLKEKALSYYLHWLSDPGRVERLLNKKSYPKNCVALGLSGRKEVQGSGSSDLRVAAVQMHLELMPSAEAYAEQIYRLVRQAVEEGAQLVAFPEDSATGLLGLLPGIKKVAGAGSLEGAITEMAGDNLRVADIFRFLAPATRRIYEATFSGLARRFGVYLAAGSAILPDATGRMVNLAHFYGPDGGLLGTQEKCHFIPMEWEWGLQTGDNLQLFSTPWTKVAIPICMDASYFETFRIVSRLGAEIVIIPTANPEEYNFWKALRGIWPRVQEALVYGVNPCLVGELMGIKLTGRAGIFAPLQLTGNGDGILAQTNNSDQEEVVVANLDLGTLRRLRGEEKGEEDFNRQLYERYFPGIYDVVLPGHVS
ncbi:MAG: nitrilase [Firmicutes bacterium]|nr:nitrilase [Bacillota bacterium]MCL5040132.1 nitrilase [Bacillota bacterium]